MKAKHVMKNRRLLLIILSILLIFIITAIGILLFVRGAADREYEEDKAVYDAIRPDIDAPDTSNAERDGLFHYLDLAQAVNPDTVAWILIPDTEIDFPVVQANDNAYYLGVNFKQEASSLGVPFLDYRNSSDFSDFNSIIYGHHIKGDMMFSGLDYFRDEVYLEAHPAGILITEDAIYDIHFISCLLTDSRDVVYEVAFLNDDAKLAYLDFIRADRQADFDGDSYSGKHYLVLSTCSYEYDSARTVLVGYLEKRR